jgi:hypothetical protein
MSDVFQTPRLTKDNRPDIELPDGRVLTPRKILAKKLKVHERTLQRGNHQTTYIAGVAYLDRNAALNDIAAGLRRRNEPPRRARRGQP